MKKMLTCCLMFCVGLFYAQHRQPTVFGTSSTPTNPWTFGGNIGISGGNGGLGVSLSPRVGYKLTPDLEAAAIANYSFLSSSNYRNSLLGIGPALHYYLGRYAYFHASFQHYMAWQYNKNTHQRLRIGENALYLGGGYMQNIGGNAYLQIGASYNVLYAKNKSIFSGGFVPNIGVVVGL